MNYIKRTLLAFAFIAMSHTVASADQSMRIIQYHPDDQPTISCATGLLCEIRLAKGERITNPWIAAPLWAGAAGMAGDTPIFMVKPETGGLVTNLVLATDSGRDYHIMLVSYDYNPRDPNSHLQPLYTSFAYDDEQWARMKSDRERMRRERRRAQRAKPRLPTVAQQMDAACAAMPSNEQYGTDVNPRQFRPEGLATRGGRPACHNQYATYIQMPLGGPNPTDIPALVENANGTRRIVNYTYDAASRIFKVDDVASEYLLTTGQGKHTMALRVQWQVQNHDDASACKRKKSRACARGSR